MRPSSLALRLTALYACSNFILVGALTWRQYHTLVYDLAREDDQLLLETLAASARGVEIGDSVGPGLSSLGPWVRDVGADCQVIRGPRLALGPPPECRQASSVTPSFRTWQSPTGHPWRIVSVSRTGQTDMRREVLLDRGTDQQVLWDYRRQLSFLLPLAFFLSGLLGYGVARAGLAPLGRLARGMEAIRLDALDTPTLIPPPPAELQAVIRSLDAMLARLRAGYERLTRFSSELAHEFRTPVHVLRQQAEVALLSERSPEEYREILRSALEELEDLGRLTEDMLFLARAEDPRARVDRQALTVRAELEDVADFLEPLAAEREVRIEVHVPPHLVLHADRMLLRRAIVNLVSNAIRHTSGGRITLTGAENQGGILIQVEDTGEGITADALPQLFNRHSRVPQPHAAHPSRSGLGLSIVRGIVRLHGGTAEVTSAIGQGTCVTLRFPISTAGVI